MVTHQTVNRRNQGFGTRASSGHADQVAAPGAHSPRFSSWLFGQYPTAAPPPRGSLAPWRVPSERSIQIS